MGEKFNRLKNRVKKEYKNKLSVLRKVKREKNLKSLAEADEYIAKATAGKVYREQVKV